MIGEAVDAALMVADALAVWVLVAAAVGTGVVYAVVVGAWLIWRGVRRTASAAMGPRTDSLPPLAAEQPAEDPSPLEPSGGRSGPPLRPTPTWARKDAA